MVAKNIAKGESINIESMKSSDIKTVLNIQNETNLSRWKRSDYENEIERKDSICKVAKLDEHELIGFAVVRLLLGNSEKFDSAEIYNIAVKNDFQKQGIGQLIFEKIKFETRKKDVSEIWLEVRKSNDKAIEFYLKNGFVNRFERKDYYKNPTEDAYILRLNYEFPN